MPALDHEPQGVRVSIDGGRLVATGRTITPETRAELAAHRAELLAELLTPEAFDAWAERSAIMEHDAGMTHHEAERSALADVCRDERDTSPLRPEVDHLALALG